MNHVWLSLLLLNTVELKYYPFMIILDKCSGRCNSIDDLSTKIYVSSKTKDVNVKAFNIITNGNEAKTLTKYISCDFKCKLNGTTCNSNQTWNHESCRCECKNYRNDKKVIVEIISHVFMKMVSI